MSTADQQYTAWLDGLDPRAVDLERLPPNTSPVELRMLLHHTRNTRRA